MKSLPGGRPQYPYPPIHTRDPRYAPYLLSPTEGSFPLLDASSLHVSPRASLHSDCLVMAPGLLPPSAALPAEHVSSSTFPRMHYASQYYNSIPREDCAALTPTVVHAPSSFSSSAHHLQQQQQQQQLQQQYHANALSGHHGNPRTARLSSGLSDQLEKQRPAQQREGFHTLQYQRGTGESPGRIRHLVHSVQKLFTKSHSLEGHSSKANNSGGRGDSAHHHHQHHHSGSTSSRHGSSGGGGGGGGSSKRSKSRERRHRTSGDWWSSDDNLDSDGTFRAQQHGMMGMRQQAAAMEHMAQHCPPLDHLGGHFGRLSLKTSKSSGDIKCSACKSAPPDGKFLKRSSWSTLTVSQAKEAYRKSSLNLDKPSSLHHMHMGHHLHHYLQVPGDEWRGYHGDRDEEIPCRRMRSSSYVKAMGDEESAAESDTSPKSSPQKPVRPDALVLKPATQRPHIDTQSASLDPPTTYHAPPYRSRNQSYMRAVSTLSQASCVSQVSETEINGQFESVCESVFSELENQAMGALDLPGSFRTRSHSYLRAIQAGYSQDDDCLPSVTSSTVTSTLRSTTGNKTLGPRPLATLLPTNHAREPPPLLPPKLSPTSPPPHQESQSVGQPASQQAVRRF
ncbi:hypothetical protein ACEWY4_021916 [Coilia grayii]|uniref:Uncharacterized protein n=1 Tax=Coilia grayii TaxID=363190 RepID=A0ABD1J816_9TELE